MNFEIYKGKREQLLNEAQDMLNNGEMGEEYQNIKNSIVKLDEEFENFRIEQANLNALNNNRKPTVDMFPITSSGNEVTNLSNVEDIKNSIEYRNAFMNHVLKREPMPKEFLNASEITKTTDIGILIPNTVLERIIEKIESHGMILSLVTRTSYKGGFSVPISRAKPVATWVSEGEGSETHKKTVEYINFTYHKLRCSIAVSLETETLALSVFETTFVKNVSEAMIKALEDSIINGSGNGMPKGILSEEIEDAKKIIVENSFNYETLLNAEACLDLDYESGTVWFMHKATFMDFVGMLDANGQPIARINYGIDGKPERMLLGRKVILNNYMISTKTQITKDEVVAFLFNPADYILNTNLSLGVKRFEDNNTDDIITKSIMLVDGKVVDKNSIVHIVKKFQ